MTTNAGDPVTKMPLINKSELAPGGRGQERRLRAEGSSQRERADADGNKKNKTAASQLHGSEYREPAGGSMRRDDCELEPAVTDPALRAPVSHFESSSRVHAVPFSLRLDLFQLIIEEREGEGERR